MHPNQTGINMALLSGLVVLVILVVFYSVNIIRHHMEKTAFHKNKMKGQFHLLDVERRRIAADLHDDIGSSLSYIKLQLQGIAGAAPADKAGIEQSERHIEEVMQKVRRISFNMMPALLQRQGLQAALEDLVHLVTFRSGVKATLSYDLTACDAEVSLHIYRIVQELLNNTLKHAKATIIRLSITQSFGYIRIRFTDNGEGFNQEHAMQQRKGLGIHSIMERVHLLEGKIYLVTGEGKGTDYSIQIPYDTQENKGNYCRRS